MSIIGMANMMRDLEPFNISAVIKWIYKNYKIITLSTAQIHGAHERKNVAVKKKTIMKYVILI